MLILLSGGNDAKVYRGRKFGGIRVTATVVHNSVNTALTNVAFVPQNLTIEASLYRNGKNHQICAGNGDSLMAASGWANSQWRFFQPGFATNTGFKITTAAAVAAAEVGQVVVDIPFGGVIDCTKAGEISLKANCASGTFATTMNLNLSNVTCDLIEVEGQECGLPRILTQVISPNEVNPTFSPGDGVRAVFFINRDKTTILTADSVISQVSVDTDSKSASWNYNQVLAERSKSFNDVEDDKRCQSFCLIPWDNNKLYMGVQIKPTLNTANVTASRNYFVAWQVCPSMESVRIGVAGATNYASGVRDYLQQRD
jgi:hypothetical protein